jgi:CRISPR/Cas system-associated exonuclease Cas4 (RecB family)
MDTDSLRIALFAGAALAAVLGALVLLVIRWQVRATGFSATNGTQARTTTLVGSDTGAAIAMMVREPALGLRGRPDYVLEEGPPNDRRLVPVEVKPTRRSNRVYESDELQLGAYLLALRGTAGQRASTTGYVRYASDTFRIDLTPDLERRVRETVAAVRRGRRASVVHRSHSIRARCESCSMRHHCDERLI